MLFAEHVGENDFRVVEATVASSGSVARFVRGLRDGLAKLESFFRRTGHDYQRFNYLGEWHSHPLFPLAPSVTDDATMLDIVNDPRTRARFAVSVIVKLVGEALQAKAYIYVPNRDREAGQVLFE